MYIHIYKLTCSIYIYAYVIICTYIYIHVLFVVYRHSILVLDPFLVSATSNDSLSGKAPSLGTMPI